MSTGELQLGALRLDPAAFTSLVEADGALRLGLLVLLGGGLSQALGQSAALLANRVRPRRFVLALAVSAGLFAGSVIVWAAALHVSALWLSDGRVPVSLTVAIVGLAHAPKLLAFFALIPYFGTGIGAALTIWTYLATAVGASAEYDLDLAGALLALGSAWLLTEAAGRTIGYPVVATTRRLRRWGTGASTPATEDRR